MRNDSIDNELGPTTIEDEIAGQMFRVEEVFDWFTNNKTRLTQDTHLKMAETIQTKLNEALDAWTPGYINFRNMCREVHRTSFVVENKDGKELKRIDP